MDFELFTYESIRTDYFKDIFDYPDSKNLNENDIKEMLGKKKGPFFKSTNGAVFDFGIKDNMLDGNGIIIFPEGCIYDGTLLKGVPHGYGKFINSDGSSYIGEWSNGVREGWGVFDNGDMNFRYNGSWMKNEKHGIGNEIIDNESFDIIYDNGNEISRINGNSRKIQLEISKILKKNKILETKIANFEKKNGSISKLTHEKDSKILSLNQNIKILEKKLKDIDFSKDKSEKITNKLKEENLLVRKENFKLLSKDMKIKKADSKEIERLKMENKKLYSEKQEIIKMYRDLLNEFDLNKLNELELRHESLKKEIKETKSINTRYKLEKNVAMLKIKKLEEDHNLLKSNFSGLIYKISSLERTLENDNYLGKLFFNIEEDIQKLNNEYENKLDKMNNLNFSEDDKIEYENKINELEEIIEFNENDIKNLEKKDILLQENILKITEESLEKDYKIKELSDLSAITQDSNDINLLNDKLEEEIEKSLDKDILIESISNENNLQSNKIKTLETKVNNLEIEYQCKICMSKPSNILLMPCGHLAMCSTCETRCRRQTNQRCPMCRKVYRELIKIYT